MEFFIIDKKKQLCRLVGSKLECSVADTILNRESIPHYFNLRNNSIEFSLSQLVLDEYVNDPDT